MLQYLGVILNLPFCQIRLLGSCMNTIMSHIHLFDCFHCPMTAAIPMFMACSNRLADSRSMVLTSSASMPPLFHFGGKICAGN